MHVYEKALQSQIGEVYVATCDKEIASEVKNRGNFIMTDIITLLGQIEYLRPLRN